MDLTAKDAYDAKEFWDFKGAIHPKFWMIYIFLFTLSAIYPSIGDGNILFKILGELSL